MRHSEKSIELWERKLALKEREISLLEKKLEATKETVEDSGLSHEERAERIRRILGVSSHDEAPTNGDGHRDFRAAF